MATAPAFTPFSIFGVSPPPNLLVIVLLLVLVIDA